jgi:hypothetical protein
MMLGPVANLKGSMVTLYLVPELELEALVSRPGADATILGGLRSTPEAASGTLVLSPYLFFNLNLKSPCQ